MIAPMPIEGSGAASLRAAWIADAVTGRLVRGAGSDAAAGMQTDTRALTPGALFVARRGARLDAHALLDKTSGAGGILVEEGGLERYGLPDTSSFVIAVPDSDDALLALASAVLRRSGADVIAVTGSAGKTTVTGMCAALLKSARVAATLGNFNNYVGFPLSVLAAPGRLDAFVAELGISEPGEMERLAPAAAPLVAVLTHVGPAHLEGLGDVETVLREKSRLFLHLRDDPRATIVVPASVDLSQVSVPAHARVWRFEDDGAPVDGAEVHARILECRWTGSLQRARVQVLDQELELWLPVPGRHNLSNALAALLAVLATGRDPDLEGLATFQPAAHRSRLLEVGDLRVFDDCYNANPASMSAALSTCASLAAPGALHAVLANMLELGSGEEASNRTVGLEAAERGASTVVGFGSLGDHIVAGAREAVGATVSTLSTTDAAEAARFVLDRARAGDLVLVKGSRGARAERVIEALAEGALSDGSGVG